MKLKRLKSVAHSTVASLVSTLGRIGNDYAATVIYRAALESACRSFAIDVLKRTVDPPIAIPGISDFLDEANAKFGLLLGKEQIPAEAVSTFIVHLEIKGTRKDVVDLSCLPTVTDLNGKTYACAPVRACYPDPV